MVTTSAPSPAHDHDDRRVAQSEEEANSYGALSFSGKPDEGHDRMNYGPGPTLGCGATFE